MGQAQQRYQVDKCAITTCDNDAEVRGMCKACRANYLYHVNQGEVHVAMWVQKVRLKVARVKVMEDVT